MTSPQAQFVDQFMQMVEGYRNDPSGTPVGPYLHGDTGLLNDPNITDGVISTMIMPLGGAIDAIPIRTDPAGGQDGSMFGGEMVALDHLLTGVTKGDADEFLNQPTTDCADGPVGGLTKLCSIVNPYGRFRFGVREVSMVRAGQISRPAEPRTIRVLNSPQMRDLFGIPSTIPSTENAMNNEIIHRMWESAVSARRMLAERVWIGSPANNSGERRDIMGLNMHVNSGNKIDYQTSAVCTSANSQIGSYGYTDVTDNAKDIVERLEELEFNAVEWRGGRSGLLPISGWIFMHPSQWRVISSVVPIRQYMQQIAYLQSGLPAVINIDAAAERRAREELRRNPRLTLNGRTYEVVLDDTIPVDTPNQTALLRPGQYAADIVFVPKTIMGEVPATFFEFFNHNNRQEMTIQQLVGGTLTFTTDGGRIRWYVNFKNGCINMTWEFSPRLKMKAPHVAFRLEDVAWTPGSMTQSSDPDSEYFVNGGRTNTVTNKYYTPWSPTTPVSI